MILSAAMMLRYAFDLDEEAALIEAAVEDVLNAGYRCADIMEEGMTKLSCSEMGDQIVSAMKEQIAAVEEAVAGAEPVKVFVYDMAQEGGAYTCGDNFTAKLISHAGGVNIFEDMDTTWATVSWEEVVERAPEVIVINDYGSTSLEEKIEELKKTVGIKSSIKEYGIDEQDFLDRLDDMVEQAFDDQCTGANPRYPLMSEIKEMYLKAYYGE